MNAPNAQPPVAQTARTQPIAGTPVPPDPALRALLWRLIGRWLVRLSPHTSHRWRRAVLRAFGARIASTTKIRRSVRIDKPWNLSAGDLTIFGDDSVLILDAPIRIGNRCVVSQMATLATSMLDPADPAHGRVSAPITIEDDAWVAADSLVLPGVTVREGTVVGARSLVDADTQPWSICVGEPARSVKPRPWAHANASSAKGATA